MPEITSKSPVNWLLPGNTVDLLERHKEASLTFWDMPGPENPPFVPLIGEGPYLRGKQGDIERTVLDCRTGIFCVTLDHNNKEVEEAYREELTKHNWLPSSVSLHPTVVAAKEAVQNTLRPYGDYKILLSSSGNVADDMAARIALTALGGRCAFICFREGYSGAGYRGNAMCGNGPWKGDSTPQLAGVHFIDPNISELKRVLDCDIPAGTPPVLFIEQITGLGGFKVIEPEFLRQAMQEIRKRKGLFIADEVQTAPARTGKGFWYFPSWSNAQSPEKAKEFYPDIITFAKGFGNGRPFAGVAVSEKICRQLESMADRGESVGKWFDTFAGNPPDCAAATKVIEIIQREKLWENCQARGHELETGFMDLQKRYPSVIEARRGMGLMQALRLKTAAMVREVMSMAPEKGIIMGAGGKSGDVLRFGPPLNIESAHVAEILNKTGDLIKAVKA